MTGIKQQKEDFLNYLKGLGYKDTYTYKRAIDSLEKYMGNHMVTEYSKEVGVAFLADAMADLPKNSKGYLRRGIRRFDDFLDGKELSIMEKKEEICPKQFAEAYSLYKAFLEETMRPATVKNLRGSILVAFRILDQLGVTTVQAISINVIRKAFVEAGSKYRFTSSMRSFLRFSHKNGLLDKDLSEFVPHKKLRKPVPSVYTKAEQDSVLENFSDETSVGLRDRAITLIALKLGVRSGDICNLKISDVDFRTKKITFVQNKNSAWHQSELLPEIEEAMVNYLNNGRPSSGLPNVFLSEKPPIRPMTTHAVHDLTTAALGRAGVEAGERKKGAHAWRSTLSSELVSEGASHALVSEALGHLDLASSKKYVKYDIPNMRNCAIEVPPITGRLLELLKKVLE